MNDLESKFYEIRAYANYLAETENDDTPHRIGMRLLEIIGEYK